MSSQRLPTFQDLILPYSHETFLGEFWERKPLCIKRANPKHYEGLLDRRELHRLLSFTWINRRDARIVKDGEPDPERIIFDDEGRASPLALMAAYADGYTIVINNLQSRHRETSFLSRGLEMFFRQPIGANVYLTPAHASGLRPHFDDHDAFVLQLEGSKEWRLYGFAAEQPLRGEHFDVDASTLGDAKQIVRLEPGDLLYLPRGLVHAAQSTDTSSLHLTLGLSSFSWVDLLKEALALRARNELPLRFTLPPSPDGQAAWCREILSQSTERSIGDLYPFLSDAITQIDIKFISTLSPLDDGGLESLDTLDQTTISSRFRHRLGTICCVHTTELESRLYFPGNVVTFPKRVPEVLDFVASHDSFAARELPDVIDDASKLNVVRKMVIAGLLVPEHDN